jgi:hypothetical protein
MNTIHKLSTHGRRLDHVAAQLLRSEPEEDSELIEIHRTSYTQEFSIFC